MANDPTPISHIRLNDILDHPIDAVTVGGKETGEIGNLVTSIDSNSTDEEYPSAKCVYNIIYGS
jgi:hypothetical protein